MYFRSFLDDRGCFAGWREIQATEEMELRLKLLRRRGELVVHFASCGEFHLHGIKNKIKKEQEKVWKNKIIPCSFCFSMILSLILLLIVTKQQ